MKIVQMTLTLLPGLHCQNLRVVALLQRHPQWTLQRWAPRNAVQYDLSDLLLFFVLFLYVRVDLVYASRLQSCFSVYYAITTYFWLVFVLNFVCLYISSLFFPCACRPCVCFIIKNLLRGTKYFFFWRNFILHFLLGFVFGSFFFSLLSIIDFQSTYVFSSGLNVTVLATVCISNQFQLALS